MLPAERDTAESTEKEPDARGYEGSSGDYAYPDDGGAEAAAEPAAVRASAGERAAAIVAAQVGAARTPVPPHSCTALHCAQPGSTAP